LSRHVKQASRSFTYAGIGLLVYSAFMMFIAMMLIHKGIKKDFLYHISHHYQYTGFKGLIAVGILAMVMSTADSMMNAAATVFSHDLFPSQKGNLWSTRLFTVVLGVFALIAALFVEDLFRVVLIGSGFYMPVVTVPLLLAVFGFRAEEKSVLSGMLASAFMVLFCLLQGISGSSAMALGMGTSLVVIVVTHLLTGKRTALVGIKEPLPILIARQKRKQSWKRFIERIESFSVYKYLYANLPSKEYHYSLLGIYIFSSTYFGFFFSKDALNYPQLYLPIIWSTLIISALIFAYPIFPRELKSKRWVAPLYTGGIGYVFFVVSAWLVIMTHMASIPLGLFVLNALVAGLLFEWRTVLSMLLGGPILASFIFKISTGLGQLPINVADLSTRLIWIIPIVSSLMIALLRQKITQTKFAMKYQKLNDMQRLTQLELQHTENMQYKFVSQMDGVTKETFGVLPEKVERLLSELKKDNQASKTVISQLADLKDKFQQGTTYLNQALYQAKDMRDLLIERDTLTQLVQDWIAYMKQIDSNFELLVINRSSCEKMDFDKEKLSAVLSNIAIALRNKNQQGSYFSLELLDAKLTYPVISKQVDAIRIRLSQTSPTRNNDIKSYTYQESFNKDIIGIAPYSIRYIDAHYGIMQVSQNPLVYELIMPIQLKKVSTKPIKRTKEGTTLSLFSEEQLRQATVVEIAFWNQVMDKKYSFKNLKKAMQFMMKHHSTQARKSGGPFYTHPIIVARKVMEVLDNEEVVIATLLHDASEDSTATISEIAFNFGNEVAELVDKLTKLKGGIKKYKLSVEETKAKLVEGLDKRVVCIKVCDRIHNLETLQALPKAKQKQILENTRDFYIPLAQQSGFVLLSKQLKRLCDTLDKINS